MTPDLYHRLDAVLPRVPAGIPALGGDLTDTEDRAVALRWLCELYREAECVTPGTSETALFAPESDEGVTNALSAPGNGTGVQRHPHAIRHGDTWEVRNGRATVTGSNDWPPPAKGTHESDLFGREHFVGGTRYVGTTLTPNVHGEFAGGVHEYEAAEAWSRTPEETA